VAALSAKPRATPACLWSGRAALKPTRLAGLCSCRWGRAARCGRRGGSTLRTPYPFAKRLTRLTLTADSAIRPASQASSRTPTTPTPHHADTGDSGRAPPPGSHPNASTHEPTTPVPQATPQPRPRSRGDRSRATARPKRRYCVRAAESFTDGYVIRGPIPGLNAGPEQLARSPCHQAAAPTRAPSPRSPSQ
jgi:hypothetical protein